VTEAVEQPGTLLEEGVTTAMVLLPEAVPIEPRQLRHAWGQLQPHARPPIDFQAEDGTLTFDLDGQLGFLSVMPARIPDEELFEVAQTSWLFPEAIEALADYQAHAIVGISGQPTPQSAETLTRLLCAVLRATPALGVYWGSAGHLVRADVFTELAQQSSLPVLLWVDFRCGHNTDGTAGLFTVGLSEFGLMEIEIPSSEKEPGELREFASDVAAYLLENGPVLADGHTVGGTEEDQITVHHAPSILDRPGPVYRLEGF
jgi:Domain of unknown function (DUF4261)